MIWLFIHQNRKQTQNKCGRRRIANALLIDASDDDDVDNSVLKIKAQFLSWVHSIDQLAERL